MKPLKSSDKSIAALLIDRKPCATAHITGLSAAPGICGTVRLYATPLGVVVTAEIDGLPQKTPRESYRVCFRAGKRLAVLTFASNGQCGELTHRFSVEDVLGNTVSICRSNSDDLPLAVGEVRGAAF